MARGAIDFSDEAKDHQGLGEEIDPFVIPAVAGAGTGGMNNSPTAAFDTAGFDAFPVDPKDGNGGAADVPFDPFGVGGGPTTGGAASIGPGAVADATATGPSSSETFDPFGSSAGPGTNEAPSQGDAFDPFGMAANGDGDNNKSNGKSNEGDAPFDPFGDGAAAEKESSSVAQTVADPAGNDVFDPFVWVSFVCPVCRC